MLENQLRSWAPRRPSARLKRRIFSGATGRNEITAAIRWLAPAVACFTLVLAAFHQQNGIPSESSRRAPMAAMILSNQTPAAYLSGGSQQERNNFTLLTFEWTNRNGSTSSIGSFGAVKVTH